MVATRTVKDRRTLRFEQMDDILSDVQNLDAAGTVQTTGNWSPGQVVEHVALFIEYSLDGFPFTAPWPLRLIGPLFRKRALTGTMKPGLRLPVRMRALEPGDDVTWEQAVAHLRRLIERLHNGELMQQPSPVLGPMSHENWTQLHCRHAEMHFSFLKRPQARGTGH